MTTNDISEIIKRELEANEDFVNPHEIDLKNSLLNPPIKMILKDSFNDNKEEEFWVVLEEDKENHKGYKIIFDENNKKFGLATENDVFIGYYGTFSYTLT